MRGRARRPAIRVALFSNTYKPIINGIVASMEALRLFLEREGHEVYVFAPRYPGYDGDGDFVRRLPSVTLPAKVRFPLALPVAPGLSRQVERLGIDLFHSHHPFGIGEIARRIAHRARRPLVTTIHTQYEHYLHYIPLPGALLRPAMRWSLARYCGACQGVTTPAAGMQQVIRDYGVRGEVRVVPNGVNLRRYREASGEAVRRRHGLATEDVVALFTGRVAPEKNLPALLEAAQQVSAREARFRLMILGDGPELPALQRQAATIGLAGTVLFPGAVPHEDVAPYCRAADLFVTASTTEVNPTSIIEAMAAGTPVVAYDTFGAREIVSEGEDGILTRQTPAALAEAIAGLVADGPARAAMAAAAAGNAERFSLEAAGRQMLAVYEEARGRMKTGRKGRDG
ncbi:MAG: glycosyltransferase [Armatimonadetes bacterium]|nr:glycosyltransferase [Armatimonadota bacterium]